MGRTVNTIGYDEQVEITIDRPGKYFFNIRELKGKAKTLVIVRTNRRPRVRRRRKKAD